MPLVQEEDELHLSDIVGLDPLVVEHIQQKVRDKVVLDKKHAKKALYSYDGLFCSMYRSLANFANVTSDSVRIYLRLFSFTYYNQQRLVRTKMSSIFKPNMRRALNTNTSEFSQGIFGGVSNVVKNLKESKEINTQVKQSLLQTKKTGKAGTKSGKNKGKKPAAGDPRPRTRKVLKRRPVAIKPKPRTTLGAPRRRRTPPRRKKRMTHISQ